MHVNRVDPSFFVGVMHINREPWISIVRDGQIPTWPLQTHKKFEVIYFHSTLSRFSWASNRIIEKLRWNLGRIASYGISYCLMVIFSPWRNSIPKSVDSTIEKSGLSHSAKHVKIPEMTSTIRWKKIAMLEHFLKSSNAEYLLITNASSIINFRAIVEWLKHRHNPNVPLYAGPIHVGYDGQFVSGSFTLLNRQAVEVLFLGRKFLPLHVMDDIGFGTAFSKLGVTPTEIKSLMISSEEDLDRYSDSELRKACHFRLKSGDLSARNDAILAKRLTQRMECL